MLSSFYLAHRSERQRETSLKMKTVAFVILALFCAGNLIGRSSLRTGQSSAKGKSRPPVATTFTLVGADDLAWCANLLGAEATAKPIDKILGTVFAAGHLAYERGSYDEFVHCYDPTRAVIDQWCIAVILPRRKLHPLLTHRLASERPPTSEWSIAICALGFRMQPRRLTAAFSARQVTLTHH